MAGSNLFTAFHKFFLYILLNVLLLRSTKLVVKTLAKQVSKQFCPHFKHVLFVPTHSILI